MSYSFSAKGATKAAAKAAVAAEFDKVIASQPVHAADKAAAIATAEAMIDVTREPAEGEEVRVSVSGYLQWQGQMDEGQFIGANVNVGAFVGKPL